MGQRDVLDVPMARDPDVLRRVCGRCPGIAEDSTLHWRGEQFTKNLNRVGYEIKSGNINERTKEEATTCPR